MFEHGGETTLAACLARGGHHLTGIEPAERRVPTDIAMVHQAGHPEPWIIALSDPPSTWRAHDYGLRWAIVLRQAQDEGPVLRLTRRAASTWKTARSNEPIGSTA